MYILIFSPTLESIGLSIPQGIPQMAKIRNAPAIGSTFTFSRFIMPTCFEFDGAKSAKNVIRQSDDCRSRIDIQLALADLDRSE